MIYQLIYDLGKFGNGSENKSNVSRIPLLSTSDNQFFRQISSENPNNFTQYVALHLRTTYLDRGKTSNPNPRRAVSVALTRGPRAVDFIVILVPHGRRAAAPPSACAHAVIISPSPTTHNACSHRRGKPMIAPTTRPPSPTTASTM